MIPVPGETAGEWWDAVGSNEARLAAAEVGGYSAEFDLATYFLHDMPPDVWAAEENEAHDEAGRSFGDRCDFTAWPASVRALAGADDRLFPVEFQRRLARERLGIDLETFPGRPPRRAHQPHRRRRRPPRAVAGSVPPVELMLRRAGAASVVGCLGPARLVADAVAEHPAGEHHDVVVTDAEVGVPARRRAAASQRALRPARRRARRVPRTRRTSTRRAWVGATELDDVATTQPRHDEVRHLQVGTDSEALREQASSDHAIQSFLSRRHVVAESLGSRSPGSAAGIGHD